MNVEQAPVETNTKPKASAGVHFDAPIINNLAAYHFDGGHFQLIDYSPVDEDLLLAKFGISSDETDAKIQGLSLVASHTNLTLNLRLMESSYNNLLELALHGKVRLGRLSKIEKDELHWSDIKTYRKQPLIPGKGSIPSYSIASPGAALAIIEKVQAQASKARRDLYDLGLCDTQIEAVLPKTRSLNFAWSLSLSDALEMMTVIDDESASWEIRSLAMKLKQLVTKLFPVFALELSK
jgi:hypothetical protein